MRNDSLNLAQQTLCVFVIPVLQYCVNLARIVWSIIKKVAS